MAIWQYDIAAVPRVPITSVCGNVPTDVPPELFDSRNWWSETRGPDETELSALLPDSSSWSQSIKAWGPSDGNRIELHFDKGELFEVRILMDLREPSKQFLCAIVELAVRHDWAFWTEEARLLEANLDALLLDIRGSRAFSFVCDPSGFLERLSPRSGGK
jgi:hypothetical protein